MAEALLLADLHLPVPARAAAAEASTDAKASFLNEAFLRFCAGPARAARQVYLLGDVFESWVGDDLGLADYAAECAALKALTDTGVEVLYQVGNRDFLLGAAFSRATGARALADEHCVTLAGVPTLLAHGDQYCLDDLGYQRWRRFSRQAMAQWLFLRLPRARRLAIGGGLRTGSAQAKSRKPESIMDVQPQAIDRALARHGVQRLIHGHTHRPAEHRFSQGGKACERIVLADWRPERIEWLRAEAETLYREGFEGRARPVA